MIDLDSEQVIKIGEAPNYLPHAPTLQTIYKWLNQPQNPLESIRIGGRRYTSVEALRRFVANCNADSAPPTPLAGRQGVLA